MFVVYTHNVCPSHPPMLLCVLHMIAELKEGLLRHQSFFFFLNHLVAFLLSIFFGDSVAGIFFGESVRSITSLFLTSGVSVSGLFVC